MWVRFTRAFDWSPLRYRGRLTRAFPPGDFNVPRSCAELAIEAGAAHAITREERDGGEVTVQGPGGAQA